MKIYKDVPIPEPRAECKTAFVKDMKVGDSVLCSGGYAGKQVLRVMGSIRTNGFKAVSRTETGHGKNAKIRIWRIEGIATCVRRAKSRSVQVGKHTKAGKKGKIIECPECGHHSLSYHFSWSASSCQGCARMIEKRHYLLPKLGKRKEAKVRAACESDNRVRQYCYLKNKHLWNGQGDSNARGHRYDVAFDALYKFLIKSGVYSQLGEVSNEAVEELAKDAQFWNILRDRFSPQEAEAICEGKDPELDNIFKRVEKTND